MSKRHNYTIGGKINDFTILEVIVTQPNQKKKVRVKCKLCDNEFEATSDNLRIQKSCGCYQKGINHPMYKHGDSHKHYLNDLWKAIKARCYNINFHHYDDYGGRGIKMHEPWIDNYITFKEWILINLGERPTIKHSLDRIENDSHYEPNNLRWATQSEQANNRRGVKIKNDRKIEIIRNILSNRIMTNDEIKFYFKVSFKTINRIIE